jgi:uroporphyrin-III C-methyltransferase
VAAEGGSSSTTASSPALLDEAPASALRIFAGKAAGRHCASSRRSTPSSSITPPRGVVRLKGGDPFIFGRGGEEVLACRGAGIPVEVVPGVSAALAAPAAAGIPLTHRGVAASFVVATGHEEVAAPGLGAAGRVDWAAVARAADTVVVLMGMAAIESIARRLVAAGRDPDTPAAVVHRAATPDQRVVTGKLQDIAARAADLGPPGVIIVGEVVRLAALEELLHDQRVDPATVELASHGDRGW